VMLVHSCLTALVVALPLSCHRPSWRCPAPRACASKDTASLNEAALRGKLQALRSGRGRGRSTQGRGRSTARSSKATSASGQRSLQTPISVNQLVSLPGCETDDVPVWEVPVELRLPGARPNTDWGRHVSLEEVFPESGLAEAWDTNSHLRTDLRRALRTDLMAPALPEHWGEKQRSFALMLDSACMVSWTPAARGEVRCEALSTAFAAHGVLLSGEAFMAGLGALCGERPHGSLIDIIPLRKRVAHSWHQDCGVASYTVLLGFPARDRYEGGGVFSHHVKLSHPLRPSSGDEHGAVVEFERLCEPAPAPIPEEYVLRPTYRRGCELWVSLDSTHVHSTPDEQLRECVWRFM